MRTYKITIDIEKLNTLRGFDFGDEYNLEDFFINEQILLKAIEDGATTEQRENARQYFEEDWRAFLESVDLESVEEVEDSNNGFSLYACNFEDIFGNHEEEIEALNFKTLDGLDFDEMNLKDLDF